jgi:uracil-DNA glycosylase family protein
MNAHERPIITEDNKTAVRAGLYGEQRPLRAHQQRRVGHYRLDPRRVFRQAMTLGLFESPTSDKIESLHREAGSCQACPLWKDATQTVFGEGPADAEIIFVGEQPGDREDREGHPFVGPAGQLLDKAMTEAGVDRRRVYVTNAVKHFKFEPRGKRRLHKRPNASEIKICRRWLFDEIEAIGPQLIVALGATAAQSLLGRAILALTNRGKILDLANGLRVFVTIHPSALLRLQDEEEKRSGYASFVNDLRGIERFGRAPRKPSKP